jgi:hypothetical protein
MGGIEADLLHLLVASSPPGVDIRSRHTASGVWKQVLMELHSLSGHMVADGYDSCITQLQDTEYLTAHDS